MGTGAAYGNSESERYEQKLPQDNYKNHQELNGLFGSQMNASRRQQKSVTHKNKKYDENRVISPNEIELMKTSNKK